MNAVLPASGWLSAARVHDRLELAPDWLRVTLDGRTAELRPEQLDSAEVWRGPDGARHYRMRDRDGRETAVLCDSAWRIASPGGRLTPLLEELGCRVVSVPAPAVSEPGSAEATPAQHVIGGSRRPGGVPGGLVVLAGILVKLGVLTTGVIATQHDTGASTTSGSAATAALITGALATLYLILLAVWWLSVRRAAPRFDAVVRPVGPRYGWRHEAGIGLLRGDGALVAADGWGRWAVLAAGSTGSVIAGPDAVVVVDRDGHALARLPVAHWANPDDASDGVAAQVGEALVVPVSSGAAPPGGEVLADPQRPSSAGTVVGCVAALLPFLSVLVVGLSGRVDGPSTLVFVPTVIGAFAVLAVLTNTLIRQVRRARGGEARGAPDDGEPQGLWRSVVLWYPIWAGGLVVHFILWIFLLSDEARQAGVAVIVVVAVVGLVFALLYGATGFLWVFAVLQPALFAGAAGLAGRGQLWRPLVVASFGVFVAAVAVLVLAAIRAARAPARGVAR